MSIAGSEGSGGQSGPRVRSHPSVEAGVKTSPSGQTPFGKSARTGSGRPARGSPSGTAASSTHTSGATTGGSQTRPPPPPGTVQEPTTLVNGADSSPLRESAA